MNMLYKFIAIEGNIGSGTTMITQSLGKKLGLPTFMQPTNDWKEWLNLIMKEAYDYGITQKTIQNELSNLKPIEKIIMRDRCQPESTITFKEYAYYRLDKTQ